MTWLDCCIDLILCKLRDELKVGSRQLCVYAEAMHFDVFLLTEKDFFFLVGIFILHALF